MMRRLLLLAPLLLAAAPPPPVTLAGQPLAQDDVLDARAMPGLDGRAALFITLSGKAAARLPSTLRDAVGQDMALVVDGKPVRPATLAAPLDNGAVMLLTAMPLARVAALAKRISGKDPLPEDLGD